MNKTKKRILIGVAICIGIIGILYMRHLLNYDLNDAEKNNKHYTSQVTAYQFNVKDKDIIRLNNGTQFEQDNLSIGDSNYDVKKPYKLNQHTIESKPKITYVKTTNKVNNEPHYYILKVY
ncbi:hypothetical protein LDL00_11380 [Staphylococcus epidermidis]|uniref:hypothetical protein n=1 Tax=Staphylococcus epidermidis TaxID=1282 RepID=UPI001E4DCD84|nr:hypothetical protein [Staphylococcus epidermidis]MCD9074425.1 hypothetical protein [Staphylococcus epidermidis]